MIRITSLILIFFNFLFPSTKQGFDVRVIENITSPQQVLWKDDDRIVFVLELDVWEYRISENLLSHISRREPNEFVGLNREGDLLFCNINHSIISSYDEFSTRFTIKDGNSEELFSFFETIRPVYIDEEKIIAVTAMDFLETNYYKIDRGSGEMVRINEPRKRKWVLKIEEDIEFKKAYVRDEKRYVVEDIFGNLYLYIR